MNAKAFFALVEQMRDAQKRYFRDRTQSALRESKSLERTVDDEIARVRSVICGAATQGEFDLTEGGAQ